MSLLPAIRRSAIACVAALGALLTAAEPVNAQSPLTIDITRVERSNPAHSQTDMAANYISYEDCVRNDSFRFTVQATRDASVNLEIWAGYSDDCTVRENRDPERQCGLVQGPQQLLNNAVEVTVPVRRIVGALIDQPGTDAAICNTFVESSPNTIGSSIGVWFLLMGSGGTVRGQLNWDDSKIDMLGPEPPTRVRAGTGESKLVVEWEAPNSVQDVRGYRFYCDPAPPEAEANANPLLQMQGGGAGGVAGEPGLAGAGGTAGGMAGATNAGGAAGDMSAGGGAAGDMSAGGSSGAAGSVGSGGSNGVAGTTGGDTADAGTGGDGSTAACISNLLVPNSIPTAELDRYICGQAAAQVATEGRATGLVNGTWYNVSVAAFDDLGHVGRLSALGCGQPQLVEDFYERYTASGGKGGGGFCSLGAAPVRGAAWAIGAAAVVLGLRRRARRGRQLS
jgi:hypothetical protein